MQTMCKPKLENDSKMTRANQIQPCVNFFFTRKSDFNRLIQEYGARNNPMKIGCVTRGFCKTLRNHRDFGVCIWSGKVYTWLNLVCSGHFLVYTLFAYRKNHRLNAVNLSKKNNGINVPELSDALKYNISQKRRSKITMNILSLHKV